MLFAKWMFWMLSISFGMKLFLVGVHPYPRKVERWQDMIDLFIALPFIIWAWSLAY